MVEKLKDHFQRAARRVQRFVSENPIKVASSFGVAGNSGLLGAAIASENPVLFASAATYFTAHAVKIVFGTGGVWDNTASKPSLASAWEFTKQFATNSVRTITPEYWQQVKAACQTIEWERVKNKTLNAWKIHENPLYFGQLGLAAGSVILAIDGLNIFGFRPEQSLAVAASGGAFLGAIGLAFLTNRNDLASPASSVSTLAFGAATIGSATGSVAGMVVATVGYLFADFIYGRIKSENQSARHEP